MERPLRQMKKCNEIKPVRLVVGGVPPPRGIAQRGEGFGRELSRTAPPHKRTKTIACEQAPTYSNQTP